MAMDGLALYTIVQELQALVGGKIDKVQQPEKDVLVLLLRCEHANQRLLINLHAENGRMQLTERLYDNPATAPAFCMLLRRHLQGARILSITQTGLDRACTFALAGRNELFDDVKLQLVVELMGKHANVILVGGDGKILDCLRHVSPSETSTRVLMPGFLYHAAPASEKRNLFCATQAELAAVCAAGSPVRALTDGFEGLGKSTASALLTTYESPRALCDAFESFSAGKFAPTVVYDASVEPLGLFPFSPRNLGSRNAGYATMSAALDAFYNEKDAAVRIRRHGSSLRRTIENALSRAQNKRKSFLAALDGEVQREMFRLNGELILANLSNIRAGMTQLVAQNYYADPPVSCIVPLDASNTPQQNAKRYFKLYRKGKLASEYAASQLSIVEEEIAYLEGQLNNIALCQTLSELDEVRSELIAEHYIKPDRQKNAKKQYANASQPMHFRSTEGYDLYVGKNNRQNDQLTMKLAQPDNLWLHAKNLPGSHVIVMSNGMPPAQTLLEAATLAAYFSSGKASPGVEVDYTLRRNIKKPTGARPGMVTFSTNKTLLAVPDALLVKKLAIT